ncbi:MAG: hypothetical protein ABI321_06945 [Polyangia bacterium]
MMLSRPLVLSPVEMKKSWGAEHWLNSTRPEAPAGVGEHRLDALLAKDPSLLGEWTRLLFGDELPIFTKLLRADFPPLVHVGFSRAVDPEIFLQWLAKEQTLLRTFLERLKIPDEASFGRYAATYAAWATLQGQSAWKLRDEAQIAQALEPWGKDLLPTLSKLRENRANIVDVLNEVDLREEAGNLLLTSAGMLHAIFGLSHQFHAIDRSRASLEALLGELRAQAARGATEEQLRALAAASDVDALRRQNRDAPKNEGWLPLVVDGELVLIEPQQSSDTTYSIADFYTPFVWDGTRVRFRKGDATTGLSESELRRQLEVVDPMPTRVDEVRQRPVRVRSQSKDGATLLRLVDDPERWPFFTAYQLELEAGTTWHGDHARGTFQQLIVVTGALELSDSHGAIGTLDPSTPAFVPATVEGGYTLAANATATLLLISVPGPHREFPAE